MPVISRFYGIIIKMYFKQSEHNPPHIHAIYGEYTGVMNIKTREIMDGDLPARAEKLLAEWVELHEKELLTIWETQNFVTIPPLN
ncbi:DUF4160 domain-containing protein [Lachnospiraceae bacterium MD329]|nr:DUF4160 domain-containing protein [Lachnospiraceae bacterium MD329]